MTHTQHTQGPWTVNETPVAHYWQIDGKFLPVAKVVKYEDATLIAAAPVMLATLRQALTALNTAPRFKVGDTDSYAIASQIGRVIKQTTAQE